MLEKAIQSVIAQNYPNLEYLVLDAASTDGTVDIIKKYADHIHFWRSEKDAGPNAAYNEGVARASGEIIAFLNADDWLEPNALTLASQAFAEDESLDMVTLQAAVWKTDAKGSLKKIRIFTGKSLELSPLAAPIPNARFWKKSIFERFGPFLTENHLGQRYIASDLEYLLRIADQELKNRILPHIGYNYFMHAGSQTFGGDPKRERQMYLERAEMAAGYLRQQRYDGKAERRLKRWHRRGTARGFYWSLKEKQFRDALRFAGEGMRISPLSWPLESLRLLFSRKS